MIAVKTGGSAVIAGVTLEGNGSAPVISAAGEVTIEKRDLFTQPTTITSKGSAPAVEVKDGAALKLDTADSYGEVVITAEQENVPAVKVEQGGTLELTPNSDAEIKAENNNGQAIELAGGALVKQDEKTITVADNGDEASYVDNNGAIILAKGAAIEGQELNAAVVLKDGTIVEGNDTQAPSVGKRMLTASSLLQSQQAAK